MNKAKLYLRARKKFWARVRFDGPIIRPELGHCWLWQGFIDKDGYGLVKFDGQTRRAHRVAVFFETGQWPEPCGLHHCDNPPCCNPTHIFEGTVADNNKDAAAKHRSNWISGSKHVESKLTEVQVLAIRSRVSNGEVQRSLAKEYGVSPSIICEIVSRKRWRHVL